MKTGDIAAFNRAAEYTYAGFSPYPKILNGVLKMEPPEVDMEGEGWRLFKNTDVV